jgi:outer membrane protein OmpA-like peptidoglycan-associated protein
MKSFISKGMILFTVLILAVSLPGCADISLSPSSGETDEGPSGTRAPAEPGVIQGIIGDQTLVATVHPIEVTPDYAVLTVDYAIPADSASAAELTVTDLMSDDVQDNGAGGVRLVDTGTGRVWVPGHMSGRAITASLPFERTVIKPGESAALTTFFAPVDTDTVCVLFPFLGLVRDIAVVDGGADTPVLEPDKLFGSWASVVDDYETVFPAPRPLASYIQAYDNNTVLTKDGSQQRMVVASDVLFATDVFTLSDSAASRVDQTAQEIAQAASGGEVRVTGHTDDVGTDAYNLDLSNKRAGSVADKLKTVLGPSFTITAAGKGESEPVAEGTDDAARAANRRVEIAFTADKAVNISAGTAAPAPDTPTATGHNPVEYTVDQPGQRVVKVSVPSVRRHGGYLVGSVTVTPVSGSYLQQDLCRYTLYNHHQGYSYKVGVRDSAWEVTLLGDAGRVFPVQYTVPDQERQSMDRDKKLPVIDILADRYHDFEPESGGFHTYTVIWPDTGQDVVTVEAPKRFRITDIPVEQRGTGKEVKREQQDYRQCNPAIICLAGLYGGNQDPILSSL